MTRKEIAEEHKPTVVLNDDYTLSFTTNNINMTHKDNQTTRKLVSVVPNEDDEVVSIKFATENFSRLQSINVSLTNACNLACDYCYEQHNKDFGRFTVESIKQAYDFLNTINNLPDKTLIFFGGEPLIHKKLILDFLNKYKDEIESNDIKINMISNGLLLEERFIKEYFSFNNTNIVLSIDTFNSSIDLRKIPQSKLDRLKDIITLIPKDRLTVRPTISHLTALSLKEFLNELLLLGVKNFIMQPLIMGNIDGFIDWSDSQWEMLTNDIYDFLNNNPDIYIEVTEGVGSRSLGNSCLNGYDIISIDPSGDFSGCFFFVNQKEKAGNLISGNIFEDRLYINRERQFEASYREMFITYDQCKTCDLQDYCYQCPAGNLDVSGTLFRPDSMCQRFVKFYLDINNKKFQIRFKNIVEEIMVNSQKFGQEEAYNAQLVKYLSKEGITSVTNLNFNDLKKSLWNAVASLESNDDVSMKDLFEMIKEQRGIKSRTVDYERFKDVNENLLYLTLLGAYVYEL